LQRADAPHGQRCWHGWHLISAVLLASFSYASGQAAEPLQIDFLSAWGGTTRPTAVTEIGVRVLSNRSEKIRLEVTAEKAIVEVSVNLEAEVPTTVWVPYRPPLNRPVEVRAFSDTQLVKEKKGWLHKPASDRSIVAVVPSSTVSTPVFDGLWADTSILTVAANALPRNADAYDVIAAMVIDVSALAALEPAQLIALQGYLASCGRVVAIALPEIVVPKFQQVAGCDGAFFIAVETLADVGPGLDGMLDRRPPPLPTASALRSLKSETSSKRLSLPVIAFAGVYFILLLVTGLVIRSARALLVLPLAAAGLALLVWHDREPQVGVIVWSETTDALETVRYSALLQIEGKGMGSALLSPLPPSIASAELPESATVRLILDREGSLVAGIDFPTFLLSRNEIRLEATADLRLPLSVRLSGGWPVVRNLATEPSMAGILAWNGQRFAVPSLAPGADWIPDEPMALDQPRPFTQLLMKASRDALPVLLVPFVPKDIASVAAHVPLSGPPVGWLIVHARGDFDEGLL
jgi:hypothetical protein